MRRALILVPILALVLSGCIVSSAVSLLADGAMLAGKSVYYAGKGVYKVGELTVRVADGVLDGSERMLRLTILTSDATGSIVRTTREIQASRLETELAALEANRDIIEVLVEKIE